MDDVPLAGSSLQFGAELLVRVHLGVVVIAQFGSVVWRDLGLFLGFFFSLDVGLVVGRGNGCVGFVRRVDVKCVVNDRVCFGVHCGIQSFEQTREVTLFFGFLVDYVHRFALGSVLGAVFPRQLAARLRLVLLGRLLGRRREFVIFAVGLRHLVLFSLKRAAGNAAK